MDDNFESSARSFINEMPYKNDTYGHRNWGHPWHSLCSYHGKLKPSIAHFLISNFTNPGDVVLDPMSGVGTIPFEACLQGRIGIGNDLSELAYIVTKAKLEKPKLADVYAVLKNLEVFIEQNTQSDEINLLMERYANFGYNGKISDYFEINTYKEILAGRKYLVDKLPNLDAPTAMVYSCFLHVLHGNRPYALSRNSHPLTPYAPKGNFAYKNVCSHIKDKLELSYKKDQFDNYQDGKAIFGDFSQLTTSFNKNVDAIICSPPFAGSIRFYMQNWMRLWLCGWELSDFKCADDKFLDKKQSNDFDLYIPFFEMCNHVLKSNGKIILHLGKTEKISMADELSRRSSKYFNEIYRGSEPVLSIENHGIKDHKATTDHEYLFLQKKN